MDNQKLDFLRYGLFDTLAALEENSPANWGVMNSQQMLEHVADFFDVSYEKIIFPLSVPEEYLPKYKAFLYSDKEFRENTKAPENVLGDTPMSLRQESLEAAKNNLQQSVENFVQFFEDNPGKETMHPAFGMLSFEEWVLLHFKHVKHHLKQFGLFPA
jgi:hypothetical protein